MQMTVQYPEVCVGHVSGSIYSRQAVAWKMTELPSNVASPDPDTCLFPSLVAAYHASPDQLPPLDELKQLYVKCKRRKRRRVHLIFIFRHSRGASRDHEQQHMREALAIALSIKARGTDEVVSIYIICARNVKGCWVPSFANDMETELAFVAQSIVAARRSSKSIGRLVEETSLAAEFTLRIKSHIIGAVVEGVCPFLVSMGTNAISHHWGRFSLLFQQLEATYGPIDIWLRISKEEALSSRKEVNRVMCPERMGRGMIGYHTSSDIVSHEARVLRMLWVRIPQTQALYASFTLCN